jgi:hypothetical protein
MKSITILEVLPPPKESKRGWGYGPVKKLDLEAKRHLMATPRRTVLETAPSVHFFSKLFHFFGPAEGRVRGAKQGVQKYGGAHVPGRFEA